jgi:hypothetical protein
MVTTELVTHADSRSISDGTFAPASLAQLRLRPVGTPAENASVLRLRSLIDLEMHASLDPLFHHHEKKETRWV